MVSAPGLHYLAMEDTPTVGRSVDDFHPRVQLRVIFREDNSFFDNPDNITDFPQKYVVTEDSIKMYVNHMELLSLRREKRSEERAEKREEEARKTYKDYDWERMFHKGSLSQLKVVELEKYIAHHNLGKYGTKRQSWKQNIIQELAKRIEREENGKSDNQSSSDSLSSESDSLSSESEDGSEEGDCVLAEIGISSSEEEEESTEEEGTIESTDNFNVNTTIMSTQGLGEEQLESKFKVAL